MTVPILDTVSIRIASHMGAALFALSLIVLLTCPAFAYDVEFVGSFEQLDYAETFEQPYDVRSTERQDERAISAQYFFGSITDTRGPRAEAAFLAPASSVFFHFSDSESQLALSADSDRADFLSTDKYSFLAGFEYLHSASRWLTRLELADSRLTTRFLQFTTFRQDLDERSVAIEVGKYINDVAFAGFVARRSWSVVAYPEQETLTDPPLGFDYGTWEVGLQGKVLLAADEPVSVGLEGEIVASRITEYIFTPDYWSGNVLAGASVYFGRARAIGLLIDAEVGSGATTRSSATLFAEQFFGDSVSVRLGYSVVDREEDGEAVFGPDGDAFSLDLLWRIGK